MININIKTSMVNKLTIFYGKHLQRSYICGEIWSWKSSLPSKLSQGIFNKWQWNSPLLNSFTELGNLGYGKSCMSAAADALPRSLHSGKIGTEVTSILNHQGERDFKTSNDSKVNLKSVSLGSKSLLRLLWWILESCCCWKEWEIGVLCAL